MAWEPIEFQSVRELAMRLMDMALKSAERLDLNFVWRGEPEHYPAVTPRIDRLFNGCVQDESATAEERVADEIESYREWWDLARHLVLSRDFHMPVRDDGIPNPEWLHFAAHHGCRTRLVDWTRSPWVALYFACCQSLERPGRVWCFDVAALGRIAFQRRHEWQIDPAPDAEHPDYYKAAFSPHSQRWIIAETNRRAPLRMESQQGLFTIASHRGVPHDVLLDELVPDGSKFVINIPADMWKVGLLGFLRSMGIHHESLHYPMIDELAKAFPTRS